MDNVGDRNARMNYNGQNPFSHYHKHHIIINTWFDNFLKGPMCVECIENYKKNSKKNSKASYFQIGLILQNCSTYPKQHSQLGPNLAQPGHIWNAAWDTHLVMQTV